MQLWHYYSSLQVLLHFLSPAEEIMAKVTSNKDGTVVFSEHMFLVGRTSSGKLSLVGDIFSNIDCVYKRHTKDNIIVLMSPHDVINQSFIRWFNRAEDWTIIYFSVASFDKNSARVYWLSWKRRKYFIKKFFCFSTIWQ